MPKEITERAPSVADDPLDDDGHEKPGIAYESTSDLRGFPMSPNGTALGAGRPAPQRPLDQPPPGTRFSAEQYAEAEKIMRRLEGGTLDHPPRVVPTSASVAPSARTQRMLDRPAARPAPMADRGPPASLIPGRATSTPVLLPPRSVRGAVWLGAVGTALGLAALVGLVLSARAASDGSRGQDVPTVTSPAPAEATATLDPSSTGPVPPAVQNAVATATALSSLTMGASTASPARATAPPIAAPSMPPPRQVPTAASPVPGFHPIASAAVLPSSSVGASTASSTRKPPSQDLGDLAPQFIPKRSDPR
jgi:hypothetical protein